MKKIFILLFISSSAWAQQLAPLTIEKIMRDPKWIGVAPSNPFWSEDGKQLYFSWNPDKNPGDSLYSISLANKTPQKVSAQVRRSLPSPFGSYNRAHTKKLYEKNGDLFLFEIAVSKANQITNTIDRESNAAFSQDEKKIIYVLNGNLFSWDIASGISAQLTDFKKGSKKSDAKLSEQEKWLKADQLANMEIVKQRSDNRKASEKMKKRIARNDQKKYILTKRILTTYNSALIRNILHTDLLKMRHPKTQ